MSEPVPENRISLVAKLAAVMAAVERVPKRGHNDFHKYDYATEADIVATVRRELASRHVMIIPQILGITREPIGDKGSILTTVQVSFCLTDGIGRESLTSTWYGCGSDRDDKGLYKAMTGAVKYFLLKTFLIPTGDEDDPERDDTTEPRATAKPDSATQQARRPLPAGSGAVYIEKAIPRQAGNRQWTEVVFSDGRTLIARPPQLGALCAELAQSLEAVVIETHQNAKGHTELDMVRRWPTSDNIAMPGDEPDQNTIL